MILYITASIFVLFFTFRAVRYKRELNELKVTSEIANQRSRLIALVEEDLLPQDSALFRFIYQILSLLLRINYFKKWDIFPKAGFFNFLYAIQKEEKRSSKIISEIDVLTKKLDDKEQEKVLSVVVDSMQICIKNICRSSLDRFLIEVFQKIYAWRYGYSRKSKVSYKRVLKQTERIMESAGFRGPHHLTTACS